MNDQAIMHAEGLELRPALALHKLIARGILTSGTRVMPAGDANSVVSLSMSITAKTTLIA